jgi:tRNA pseudouridine55 synthase
VTGLLLVDKPEGTTSAGVIRALKPRLARTKVGHLGTLDPFASGLLPLCLGEATKVARWLLLEEKRYTGVIRLGTATDTLDRTGTVVEAAPAPRLAGVDVAALAATFMGRQQQVPPMYSALKRAGVPLYELARKGIEVEREAREIRVDRLVLHAAGADGLAFELTCSKGTYVRVLAADIGRALGTVAHLETLRRTAVGAFRVEDATPLATLVPAAAPLPVVPLRTALAALASFRVPSETVARLRRGQQDPLTRFPAPARVGETALVLDPAGEVTAVIEAAPPGPAWRLARLLGTA